jgi:hypothetical protein
MDSSLPQVYRPAQLSRRGELTAWILTLVCGLALAVLQIVQGVAPVPFYVVTGLFLLAAASISLGNWMDRNTELRLEAGGVHFRNGLRDVHFGWDEIRQIQVQPGQLGDRVRVIGDRSQFYFRMGREVHYQGKVQGRMGFAEGEEVLELLLAKSGVTAEGPAAGGYSSPG